MRSFLVTGDRSSRQQLPQTQPIALLLARTYAKVKTLCFKHNLAPLSKQPAIPELHYSVATPCSRSCFDFLFNAALQSPYGACGNLCQGILLSDTTWPTTRRSFPVNLHDVTILRAWSLQQYLLLQLLARWQLYPIDKREEPTFILVFINLIGVEAIENPIFCKGYEKLVPWPVIWIEQKLSTKQQISVIEWLLKFCFHTVCILIL